ncbi:MAG TPA: hypothetical protein VEB64_18205 [Azospirillaceae bacterium]|nr:hypothetical protein [Azospirillaceae bacterium]
MPDRNRLSPVLPSTAEDVRAIAPTPETAGRVRDAAMVLAISAAVLAVVDSQGLLTWARDLAPNTVSEVTRLLVYAWHVTMDRFGAADIHPILRNLFRALHDL